MNGLEKKTLAIESKLLLDTFLDLWIYVTIKANVRDLVGWSVSCSF